MCGTKKQIVKVEKKIQHPETGSNWYSPQESEQRSVRKHDRKKRGRAKRCWVRLKS